MGKGTFIVLEGGEGAGKSTIAQFLKTQLPRAQVLFTHEPGGTEFADKIRALVLSSEAKEAGAETQFGLMWAARFEHLRHKIIPALAKSVTVVSDRFDSSTFAYQIYGQKAKHLEKLFWQTRKVFLREYEPDLYVFLDVEPKVGLARISENRKERKLLDHFEKRPLAFHKRVREGYKEFFKAVPHVVIDATRPLEAVREDTLSAVRKYLRS